MKKINRFLLFILLLICTFASFCFFGSCEKSGGAEYEIIADDSGLFGFKAVKVRGAVSVYEAMNVLRENGQVTFEGDTGENGFMISAVNGIKNAEDWSACWMVYTDLTEYQGVTYASTEYGLYDYEGNVYASASYGISGLPVIEGYAYILHYDTF